MRIVECRNLIVCGCGVDEDNTFECRRILDDKFTMDDVKKWLNSLAVCLICNSNWRIYRRVGTK